LHDALLIMGAVPSVEAGTHASWKDKYEELARAGRVTTVDERLWAATERLPMVQAAFPGARHEPAVVPPEREAAKVWSREDANRELVRGRLEVVGPTTANDISEALGLAIADVDFALAALEHEGFALRGRFSSGVEEREWCERRLLARIHRYTLDRLRKEIEPFSASDFMRFLFRWQRVTPETRAQGPEGVAAVLELLDGCELAAGAWESDVWPARATGLLATQVENGLSELVAWGLVSSDSFAGLRALLIPSERPSPIAGARRRSGRMAPFGIETAGRWAMTGGTAERRDDSAGT